MPVNMASTNVNGQTPPPSAEYQLKAVFIYNFTRFVEWPPEAFESYNDPFVIAIIGNDPFGSYLEQAIAGESIGRHPIRIKRIKELDKDEKCHIVFINEDDPGRIKEILAQADDQNILTVSDAANFASIGGMIGFFTENNKIRMHINTGAVRNAQLTISSKLLRLAKVI
jgi:YfiR/HmsC-like